MPCDYEAIRRDNERRYGTDIGRFGPALLADRYDDRSHFIFELLQNAEDALARRTGWTGHRSVRFHLKRQGLRVSHFGKPFDEADVRGICGIAESTKGLTSIGRFGIGFKSVYAFTTRPAIHSGPEDFAIENFVWPVAAPAVARDPDETVIVIPIREDGADDRAEITVGLERLGARTLLFLREIDEIEWNVESGPSGLYLRSQPEDLGDGVRRITVIGQESGELDTEESWLVFSKPVVSGEAVLVGHVELAFSVVRDEKSRRERVIPVSRSPLVVFFPTVLETHLGFLVQGPYRTTPSRDNIPRHDPWNRHCVRETASLLVDALRWLRDHELLDTGTLRCLPLDTAKFGEGSMFGPLFDATKAALVSEPLLPRFGGGNVPAGGSMLARTQDLRELLEASQLASLFGVEADMAWLSADISQDRTPDLRQYLMRELEVAEVTPEMVLTKLDAQFLRAQPDAWILRLYEFLDGQPGLRQRALVLPLIRLADGKHVTAYKDGQPQAFLPGAIETGFPTVRGGVCSTERARAFLRALGLTEPDPVDDVVRNVLPKYRVHDAEVREADYEADIRRILAAFATDSKSQREKLVAALRATPFVMTVDAGDGGTHPSKPGEVYLATDRLKELFAGVPGIVRVDDAHPCLRGDEVRELLEACGAVRYLRPIEDTSLSWEQRRELRKQAGHVETSGQNDRITDWTIRGVSELLETLATSGVQDRHTKARLLWEELAHLEERRGKAVFMGEYTWTHYGTYHITFDAAFVRLLNRTEWVPASDGKLQRPEVVLFDSLGWKPSPFLLSKLRFKPPIVDQLAKEAGIEPGVLDLLKKLGLTSEAQLRARLGVQMEEEAPPTRGETAVSLDRSRREFPGATPPPTPPAVLEPAGTDVATVGSDGGAGGPGAGEGSGTGHTEGEQPGAEGHLDRETKRSDGGPAKRAPGSPVGHAFVSYVAVHPEEEQPDPDGLEHATRLALEAQAIDFILANEPNWRRTPPLNRGYDLFQTGFDGRTTRWCEVKAMTGSLEDRPVGLSRPQFDCAREHGSSYWLYVVEQAGTERAHIVRIRDPVGKARTFTFDSGWIAIAEPESSGA